MSCLKGLENSAAIRHDAFPSRQHTANSQEKHKYMDFLMDYTMQNITKSFPVYFMLCIPLVLCKTSSELASIVILARSPVVLFKITKENKWSYMPITMHPML